MATETLADVGLVRISQGSRPVGAGFIIDDRHIVTCAHVVNASLGRALIAAERPDAVGPVAVRVGGEWIPVEVTLAEWIPLTEDYKRGDVAVLEMTAGRPAGVSAVPLRRPQQSEDRRFSVQGFPDGTLIGATGVIRAQLTIGQEWAQLEDDKQAGRAVTEGFSGAPIWDTALNAVVGMAIAKDRAPAAKIAAMLPVTQLAGYWPPVADLVPSRLALDPRFDTYWDPRARGVETAHLPGTFFTGRHRALTELVEWLSADPQPADNLRVVSGGPGSGKSGVLARLVTASDPGFRRRHPPVSDDPLRELPEGAVDVAVHARGLDPTQILQALAAGVDCDATDVDALVARLAAHGRPVTLVVDGLDESTRPSRAAAVLRRAAGDTADLGVRLLVGTRPGPQTKLLQTLGASAARNAIDLDDTTYLEKNDLAEYVRRRLLLEGVPPDRLRAHDTPYRDRDRLAERVAERVANRAYPSFLIAALTAVGLIRSGTVVDVDVDGWDQFPTTVADAMDDYLDRFDQDRDRVEDLLRPLAYSYGDGLPPDELWAGLAVRLARPGRTYTVKDIGWLLDTAADYLFEAASHTGKGTAYRLYHQALIDHLRDQDPARGGAVEVGAYRWLLDSVPRRPQGDADWERAHPYTLTHLADHAAATGHLGDLVDDPAFLLAANPTALTASLRQSPQITNPGARTYRMAAHLLADPSDRLFKLQLHAARLGETTLERQLAALAVTSTPRLAWTRERGDTPPGGGRGELARRCGCGTWPPVTRSATPRPHPGVSRGGRRRAATGARWWSAAAGIRRCGCGTWPPVTRSATRSPATPTGWRRWPSASCTGARWWSAAATIRRCGCGTWPPVTRSATRSPATPAAVDAVAVGELDGPPGRGQPAAATRRCGCGTWPPAPRSATRSPATPAGCAAVAVGAAGRAPGRGHRRRRRDGAGVGPGHRRPGRRPAHRPHRRGRGGGGRASWTGARSWSPAATTRRCGCGTWPPATRSATRSPATPARCGAVAVGELRRPPGRGHRQLGRARCGCGTWPPATRSATRSPATPARWTAVAVGELDGRPVVVTGSDDGTVRVWDLATGDPVGDPFTGHTGCGRARWPSASCDGRPVVVTGSDDATVRVWDLATGDPVGDPFTGHTGSVERGGGRRAGRAPGRGHRQLRRDGAGVGPGHRRPGRRPAHRPHRHGCRRGGGRRAGRAPGRGHRQRRRDGAGVGPGHRRPGRRPVHRPHRLGRRRWRSASWTGARSWSPAARTRRCGCGTWRTGDPVGDPFTGHTDGVTAVAVGELDGRPVVVSGSRDATVRVWDLATGGNPRVIRLDVSVVLSVTKPKNNMVVIGHRAGLTAVRI